MIHKPVRIAVLPVAGLGTRVLPATKSIPKEMLTIIDRPAIQYAVDEARAAGIEHFVFVTGRNKNSIEDYFDQAYELERTLEDKGKSDTLAMLRRFSLSPGASSFVRQQSPQGLGHAIWCARAIVGDEPFAVLLPDDVTRAEKPVLAQMVADYEKVGGNFVAVDAVPIDRVSSYGVIDPGARDGRRIAMRGMVEKPQREAAPSNFAITGRYILQPEIMGLLEDQQPGAGNEIQLTDAMARLMRVQPFHAWEFEGRRLDCGSVAGYLETVLTFAEDRPDTRAVLDAFLQKHAMRGD